MSDFEPDLQSEGRKPLAWWAKIGIASAMGVGLVGVGLAIRAEGLAGSNTDRHKDAHIELAAAGPGLAWVQPQEPTVQPAVARVQPAVVQQIEHHATHREVDPGILAFPDQQQAPPPATARTQRVSDPSPADPSDPLGASLRPTRLDGTNVREAPDPNFLISAGRVIPCTDQTAINSSYPGGVTALIPINVQGDTGTVTVLDKGSKVVGTIQHAMTNGVDRVFVLWQKIVTIPLYDSSGIPHEYEIDVNSPASMPDGSGGLDGDVNRHMLSKIGGILGVSLIQGGAAAAASTAQGNHNGNNLNLYQFQGGADDAASIWLQHFVNIPDVLTRLQGQGCSIFVLRDLNMRGAYNLRMAG